MALWPWRGPVDGLFSRSGPADRLRVPGVTTSATAVARAANPSLPSRLWIADLAPLSVLERPLYIGVVLDCCSRRCLGWRFSERLEPELIAGAVEDAAVTRSPFDRTPLGRPVALALAERCPAAGVGLSHAALRPGDRMVSADFFNWLAADLLAAADWPAAAPVIAAINRWILGCYNPAVAGPPVPWFADPAREDAEESSA